MRLQTRFPRSGSQLILHNPPISSPLQCFPAKPSQRSVIISLSLSLAVSPCNPRCIFTFIAYLQAQSYLAGGTYNDSASMASDFVADFNATNDSATMNSANDSAMMNTATDSENVQSVSDIVQLLHTKQQRIREILMMRKREQKAVEELNESRERYKTLQTTYQQIEYSLQHALTSNQDDA